jgi:serine protease Do
MKWKINSLSAALVAAGVLAASTASAFDLTPNWLKGDAKSDNKAAVTAPVSDANAPAAVPLLPPLQGEPNYRAIVKQFGPAVVGVTVAGMHKTSAEEGGMPPGMENDPFFQFFRGMPGMQQRGPNAVPFKGMGSGFIISSDGLILTNAHVVREAKDVTVKLSDRREFNAKVLGIDPTTDVAVLRIDAKGLPTVRLGDPRNVEVGDRVLAIGAPYGLEQTATQGIVSAKGRSLPGDSAVPFIQTDAAVNPGNSGGPLFDGQGQVIGINAQIYSQSGGFQGLSFSIPINVALKVKDQIVATGKASHGRLGVQIQNVNQALAESFGLKRADGALVSSVEPNSAAAAAGLKSGDVITEVNGQPIVGSVDLSSAIGMAAPGDKVKLTVWRDRDTKTVEAKLGGAKDDDEQVASADGSVQHGKLGLSLRPLTRDERRESGIEQGLLVENVGGPAAKAGLQPGDVVLAINGRPVQSMDEIKRVLDAKPKSVALLIQREGAKIFMPVNLG